MIFKLALTKDNLRETLMNIINNSSGQLDEVQTKTFKGLLHLEKELSIENEDLFCTDVNYSLNLCVELLSELEADNILKEEDKKEFDYICKRILEAQEIECSKHITMGKLVTYEGLSYQICEIDYDELTVCLADNEDEMGGNCIDVNPTDIDVWRKEEKFEFIDFIEHIKPMINDLKDGEEITLTENDIDGLMRVIRAKVELHEGLISQDEHDEKMDNAYE